MSMERERSFPYSENVHNSFNLDLFREEPAAGAVGSFFYSVWTSM